MNYSSLLRCLQISNSVPVHGSSAIHKAAGSLVTGRSLQNGKICCWQERPSDTVLLFTASWIFRNCTSQIMERLEP